MAGLAIHGIHITSTGGYICWPKIVSNNRTWDGRHEHGSWALKVDQEKTVNLVNDAGFSEGEAVIPWLDILTGVDISSNTIFSVAKNGRIAAFTASGTTMKGHMYYTGIKQTNNLI